MLCMILSSQIMMVMIVKIQKDTKVIIHKAFSYMMTIPVSSYTRRGANRFSKKKTPIPRFGWLNRNGLMPTPQFGMVEARVDPVVKPTLPFFAVDF